VHDPIFRQAEKDWHSFVEKLTERLTEIDDTVPELPVKDIVGGLTNRACCKAHRSSHVPVRQIFRIYRDVRFSSDPTPYKVKCHHASRADDAVCPRLQAINPLMHKCDSHTSPQHG